MVKTATTDRILVVEDDDDVRGAVTAVLENHGYNIIEAANGRVALQQLKTSKDVFLILLDLFMPDMDGWTFRTEQMKDARLANIPVVVMSADHAAAKRSAAQGGVIAAIRKPIEFDTLLEIIQQL